jgi:S1-C subfamily serine protease
MTKRWMEFACLGLAAAGAALADPSSPPKPPVVAAPVVASPGAAKAPDASPAPAKPAYRNFAFTHLVVKLPADQVYETYRLGSLCLGNYTKTWPGGQAEQRNAQVIAAVKEEMRDAGFKVDGDSDNIFEKDTGPTSETELGAIIDDASFNYCLRTRFGGYGANSTSITGSATMSVEWQVYDKLQKTIIAKVRTDGTYEVHAPVAGGTNVLFMGAFRDNLKKLGASGAFRTALATPEGHDLTAASPTKQPAIPLPGALAATSRPVGDAVGAVLLIFAGQSEGSGFLASTDGLVLTDRHVVGEAKYVKVRWSDGIEGLGEVVRSDKVRDVALVKTDPRGRKPLALRRDPLQPGDTVYAIGAPMGDKFQSTVTRGVVSAYRTFDGLSYIQSDVNVNHGSSGGPLLDDRGEAVGLTESGIQPAGAPAGINLFTPVRDALEFLSAEPH